MLLALPANQCQCCVPQLHRVHVQADSELDVSAESSGGRWIVCAPKHSAILGSKSSDET